MPAEVRRIGASTSASLVGSGSGRTQPFALQTGDYRIRWEARPILPSGIGCTLSGVVEGASRRRVGEPFGGDVIPSTGQDTGQATGYVLA